MAKAEAGPRLAKTMVAGAFFMENMAGTVMGEPSVSPRRAVGGS